MIQGNPKLQLEQPLQSEMVVDGSRHHVEQSSEASGEYSDAMKCISDLMDSVEGSGRIHSDTSDCKENSWPVRLLPYILLSPMFSSGIAGDDLCAIELAPQEGIERDHLVRRVHIVCCKMLTPVSLRFSSSRRLPSRPRELPVRPGYRPRSMAHQAPFASGFKPSPGLILDASYHETTTPSSRASSSPRVPYGRS